MSWNWNQLGDPQNPQKALVAGTQEQGHQVLWDQVREVANVWRRIWICEHWVWIFFMFCHYSSIRDQILLKLAEKTLASQFDTWAKFSTFKISTIQKNEVRGLSWWPSGKESTCQGRRHEFEPWSRKIPHAVEQLSPCATTTESVL